MSARVTALLASALLAATALVRVPVELYGGTLQDFSSASRDVLLTLCAAGLVLFAVLAAVVVAFPRRLAGGAAAALAAIAGYAWIRSGFFPGPSVSLDGSRPRVDLSTGAAGLLVPLAGGALLAALSRLKPRIAAVTLGVLLGGSLVQSAAVAVSVWNATPPVSEAALSAMREWSREGNVIILLLDSLQSDVFADMLETRPSLRDRLDGFRFYTGAASSSPTTYLSLPTIHSGRLYDPEESAAVFFEESVHENSVLNRFAGAGYRVSYAMGVGGCPREVTNCLGTLELARSRSAGAVEDASRLVDLGIYRVLPDGLRRAQLGSGQGAVASIVGRATRMGPEQRGAAALATVAESARVTDSPPTVKMIHSMITHPPAVLQADCSTGERRWDRAGAALQALCAFRYVATLLESLKAAHVYDVTDVVILADHGYGFESRFAAGTRDARFERRVGAFNPLLLVKPAGARGSLTRSDAPIDLADLARALCGEPGCSPAEGLRDLEAVDRKRTRVAFWYVWRHRYWNLPRIPGLIRYSIRGDLASPESWQREAASYTPGTVLDFRRGRNAAPYRGFGWGRPQPDEAGVVGARATVRLRAEFEASRPYQLVLEARLTRPSARPRGRLAVEVNGLEIGELTSRDPPGSFELYRLEVPASVLARSRETAIAFRPKEGARPALRTLVLRPMP